MIDSGQQDISLIREYRTRLIADVVTGKVDVRHLAPEKVEALEEGLEDDMFSGDKDELEPDAESLGEGAGLEG